ncbi:MAG TPA: Sua5/YciO/YrdC/YwlC family protein, partial [Burkholderiales bacterium]|nr:Sua5/YciO/YrdC/YwlC family protein [Burkholderiales bacterium]
MLPYAPLQYLIFHEAAGRPEGISWLDEFQELILVATSGNPMGEPIARENDEALRRLEAYADLFLVHDREILVRCDDSVMRCKGGSARFLRRARGYAPSPLKLPFTSPSILATGSAYKNTVCLTRRDEAFVSQHVGDLDNAEACRAMDDAVDHLLKLLKVDPEIVAHDLHPDFYSTRFAQRFSERLGIPCMGIQHHHAHVAAVMAEHGLKGPVLGLALDGTGLGNEGGIWGGELLQVDEKHGFRRLGHLKEILLPGGDAASREPWRIAAGFLHSWGRDEELIRRYGKSGEALAVMIERRFNTPSTSSMGRLFDAAAGLLGIKDSTTFEGQAAMLLEKMAEGYGPVRPMGKGYFLEKGMLDFAPLLEEISEIGDKAYGASLFHCTLVEGLGSWVLAENMEIAVFSGGCFMNGIFCTALRELLEREGIAVFEAERLPPNDGGISLGQAYAAMLEVSSCA